MRRTKEEAQATREALLDAALAVFSRRGYAASTLEDISSEAGVTRGALYWHFPGKAAVYNALMRERFGRANEAFAAALRGPETVAVRLRRLLVLGLGYGEQDRGYRALLELGTFRTELTEELAQGMDEKREATRQFAVLLEALVREGQAEGSLRGTADPRAAALGLLGFLNGMILLWLLDPALFSPATEGPSLVDQYLRGLEP